MKNPHLFTDLTVLDLKNYLRQKNSVIIPVGVIEQHGHHLPTFTDSIIGEGIASRIAEKLDIIYTPALYTSYSGGCLPGTINFNPCTLVSCLNDMCASLAMQGFRNIFIILSHGGSENLKVIEASLHLMVRENPIFKDVMVLFTPFWRYCDKFMDGFFKGDGHGGNGETSFIKYLRPDLVMDTEDADDDEVLAGMKKHPDFYQKHEKPCDVPEVLPRITQKDSVKVGVMGDIGAASAEHGKAMVDECVTRMSELFQNCLNNRKPLYFEVEPDLGEVTV